MTIRLGTILNIVNNENQLVGTDYGFRGTGCLKLPIHDQYYLYQCTPDSKYQNGFVILLISNIDLVWVAFKKGIDARQIIQNILMEIKVNTDFKIKSLKKIREIPVE